MGAIWIHDVPAKLRAAGVKVETEPGWEFRSRSTGGYDSIMAVGIHHDAWPAGRSLDQRTNYAWKSAPARPIGAMWIHTDGTVRVGAAGATNTQGRMEYYDKPIRTSKGVIDSRSTKYGGMGTSFGNRNLISIEMSNDGVGEVWPKAQLDALTATLVVLCEEYDLDPLTDIISHHRYTGRKVDPRGPTPSQPTWGGSNKEWDDDAVASTVIEALSSGDIMFTIDKRRIYDSRIPGPYSGNPAEGGQTVSLQLGTPPGAKQALIRLTTAQSSGGGYCSVWGAGAGRPVTSDHNFAPGPASGTLVLTDVHEGAVNVYFSAQTHFIVDMVGWV